jgi:hypothetical protein
MVWNAVVFHKLGNQDNLDKMRELLQDAPPPVLAVMERLIGQLMERKKTLFADDDRLIGEFKLYHDRHGELRPQAEVRGYVPKDK